GLVVNRSLEIFPSWSALFNRHHAAPPPTVVADATARLDVWLHARAVEGARNGLVFEWRPGGVGSWHLAAAPVIYVPPRYFTATAARFPVVVVVAPTRAGPAQGAWDPRKINQVVPHADAEVNPAVLVFLRTDHPDETVLTEVLPGQLDEDLRTAARGWAVVGVGADAGFTALARDPLRFWFAVAIDGAPRPAPPDELAWQATLSIIERPPGHGSVQVVARPEDRLPAAFQWVYRQLDLFTTWSEVAGHRPLAPVTGQTTVDEKLPSGSQIVTFNVPGPASGISLAAKAYLPPGYNSPQGRRTHYPVVEALAGFPGTPNLWVVSLHIGDVLDHEIAAGRMAPAVVVFPLQDFDQTTDSACVDAVDGARL